MQATSKCGQTLSNMDGKPDFAGSPVKPSVTLQFSSAANCMQQTHSTPAWSYRKRVRSCDADETQSIKPGTLEWGMLESQGPWEKVLWRKQPYPDNYTDSSFLQHLVVNADVPERDFWQVVLGSAAVTQQLATVVAAVVVPVHLRLNLLQGQTLLLVNIALLLVGYVVCGLLGRHVLGGSLRRGVRQVALLSGGVYLMSPMLHTLTKNISQDSVIAMIVGLCILHLFLHDYNFVNSVTEQLTGTLSLGAAVFASVLFASGMPTEFDVFVHILFCLELYLLSPFMRRYIRNTSMLAHVLLTVAMVAAAVLLLLPLSGIVTAAYVLAVVSVSFICPYWLVHIQKFKAKINGPWDEAVPKIPMSIHYNRSERRQGASEALHTAAAAAARREKYHTSMDGTS